MKTFLFLGDSITDSHRLWLPRNNGLGDGFVKILSDTAAEEHFSAVFINKGHDGFTLPSLIRNLPTDCFPCQPDFITVLIGINDIAVAKNCQSSFSKENFSKQYEMILEQILSHTHAKILCMGPFLFPCPQEYALWIGEIRLAEQAISSAAARYGLPFLPLHDFLNDAAEHRGYDAITTDGIHLTVEGHRLLAGRWMKAISRILTYSEIIS